MKNDFINAISGKKPIEVFRVHCNLKNGMVGITSWYTMAVYEDFLSEVKTWSDFDSIALIERSKKAEHLK